MNSSRAWELTFDRPQDADARRRMAHLLEPLDPALTLRWGRDFQSLRVDGAFDPQSLDAALRRAAVEHLSIRQPLAADVPAPRGRLRPLVLLVMLALLGVVLEATHPTVPTGRQHVLAVGALVIAWLVWLYAGLPQLRQALIQSAAHLSGAYRLPLLVSGLALLAFNLEVTMHSWAEVAPAWLALISLPLLIVHVTEYWLTRVRARAHADIVAQTPALPAYAQRLYRGRERRVATAFIEPGMVLIVGSGEICPADGRVIEGHGRTSLGEENSPDFRMVRRDDLIHAGERLMQGQLVIQATAANADSVIASLASEQLRQLSRAPALAGRVRMAARWFPWLAVSAAVVLYVGMVWQARQTLAWDASTALVLLAALSALSPGVSLRGMHRLWPSALAQAVRAGLFVRNGLAALSVRQVTRLELNLSSLLRLDRGSLVAVEPVGGTAVSDLLSMIYWLTADEGHPLARLLHRETVGRSGRDFAIKQKRTIAGAGIEAISGDGRSVRLGSRRWLGSCLEHAPVHRAAIEALQAQGLRVLLVTVDQRLAGYVAMSYELRSDTARVIRLCKRRLNWRACLVSGEDPLTVNALGRFVAMDQIEGGRPWASAMPPAGQREGLTLGLAPSSKHQPLSTQVDISLLNATGAVPSRDAKLVQWDGSPERLVDGLVLLAHFPRALRHRQWLGWLYNTGVVAGVGWVIWFSQLSAIWLLPALPLFLTMLLLAPSPRFAPGLLDGRAKAS